MVLGMVSNDDDDDGAASSDNIDGCIGENYLYYFSVLAEIALLAFLGMKKMLLSVENN